MKRITYQETKFSPWIDNRVKRNTGLLSYREYLQSDSWKTRRDLALQRANHKCETCSSASRLAVHHLSYSRVGNELLSDLQVLCDKCHKAVHNEWNKDKQERQAKNLPGEDWKDRVRRQKREKRYQKKLRRLARQGKIRNA